MERQLRILLLEDSSTDAELMLFELRRAGVAHVTQCVSTLEDFLAALTQFNPDLVLSDQKLPGFTGTEALVLARRQRPDLPFILVTGALGEEVAVETIKSGATDYILKHRLFQLAPAVLRAVRETEQRTQRRQAEESLKIQHQQLKLQNQLLQQIQRQLSASQERYSRLYDTAPIGYTSLNEKGVICEINATAARMLGLLRTQLIGMPFSQFVSSKDQSNFVAHLQQCTDSEVPARAELTLITNGKHEPMVELLSVRTQELRQKRTFYQTTITDITERKEAEQILRQSEERFRQFAENIHEVFWMTDAGKNQMIYVSPGYETIWERSCESLYASPMNWIEAIHPEDRDRVVEAAFTKQISGQYDEVYRIVRPDGSVRWIEDRAFPIRDGSGNVYRLAGIAEDVTNHKRAEEAAATLGCAIESTSEAI